MPLTQSDLAAIARIRTEVSDVRTWLVETERKLDTLTARGEPVQLATTDELVAAASTATAVYKALETELKIDRRTILAKVERLVRAHELAEKFPDWSRDVRLAKHLASRTEDGRIRLVAALEALA